MYLKLFLYRKVMIVKLPESFNANAMELVVEFFYSRKLHIDQNIVADVLIIAEFLQVFFHLPYNVYNNFFLIHSCQKLQIFKFFLHFVN